MPKEQPTHDYLAEIAKDLNAYAGELAEAIQAEGPIPTKIHVMIEGIYDHRNVGKLRNNRARALTMRRLLLQKAGGSAGRMIMRARQAGALFEHAELIDDIFEQCKQLPIEPGAHELFRRVCRHVLPAYDRSFELRAIRTKTLADAYVSALRLLAKIIMPPVEESPPASKESALEEPDEPGTAAELTGDDVADKWPPSNYVAVSTIERTDEYKKSGKNPPRTTIQRWETADPVVKVHAPGSNEVSYPKEWVDQHWNAWSPRSSKRNTPA